MVYKQHHQQCAPAPHSPWQNGPAYPALWLAAPTQFPHFPTPHTLPVPHNSPISTQQTAALCAGPPSTLHTEFAHYKWQNGPAQPALWPAAPTQFPHFPIPHTLPVPHNSPISTQHTAALWAGPPSILHTEFPHSQWQNGPAQPALWPAAPQNRPIPPLPTHCQSPHNFPISTQQQCCTVAGPPSILHTEFPHSQWQNGPAQPALWPAAPHNSPIAQSHTIPPPQGPGGWAVYRKPHSVGWLVSTQAVHVHIVELCVAPQLAVHVHTVVMVWYGEARFGV